jgi:hypothetical protein
MNTSILAIIAVGIGGMLVGALAHPVSWRLVAGVFALGVTFLLLEIAHAVWVGVPPDGVMGLLALTSAAETSRFLGAIAIAYAAFIATVILAARVILARKRQPHEP